MFSRLQLELHKHMSSKRDNHHTVPSMFLKRFTVENKPTGTLWQLELLDRSVCWQKKSPKSLGRIFRFYEVPNSAIDGNSKFFEEKLGEHFEDMWSRSLDAVMKSNSLPTVQNEYENILQFVAFSAIRTARFKATLDSIRTFLKQCEGAMSLVRQVYLSNPDAQFRGVYLPAFEKLLEGDMPLDQDNFVKFLILYSPVNYWIFGQRRWELREITAESPFLICSDDPVVVVDEDDTYLEPFDVLRPDSTVFIPLSRTHLLGTVSTSSEQPPEITIDEVAKLNSYQFGKARKLFMCEPKLYLEMNGQPTWLEK
jgi:Protein of unknown function (DUF4238)